jgi:pyruvate/2-oxoglutarate dehydrogenase complex dihydrolipoamide dehydrogenase (E3) component
MGREDPEISEMVRKKFEFEGINVLTEHSAVEVIVEDGKKVLVCDHKGETVRVEFDEILVAVGRMANIRGFGLEDIGVEISKRGTIEKDEFLRTTVPNIFCAGDVAGPYQFTHTAAHQAWYASVNSLFGKLKMFKSDYRVIPWATFTDPEVARVGLNETDARENGIEYEVTTYGIDDLDRAIADSEDHGIVKVLTVPGKDKILGVTIVGTHASDIIAEYILAMKHGLGLNKILGTIHIYPSLAEANKFAAGEWKKAHAPENILNWISRYHQWMRR